MGPFMFGAPGRIRTSDPLVRSQVLYPAELRAHKLLDLVAAFDQSILIPGSRQQRGMNYQGRAS